MRTDTLFIHSDDIGGVVGKFHGIPVNEWCPESSFIRENEDMRLRIILGKERNEVSVS